MRIGGKAKALGGFITTLMTGRPDGNLSEDKIAEKDFLQLWGHTMEVKQLDKDLTSITNIFADQMEKKSMSMLESKSKSKSNIVVNMADAVRLTMYAPFHSYITTESGREFKHYRFNITPVLNNTIASQFGLRENKDTGATRHVNVVLLTLNSNDTDVSAVYIDESTWVELSKGKTRGYAIHLFRDVKSSKAYVAADKMDENAFPVKGKFIF